MEKNLKAFLFILLTFVIGAIAITLIVIFAREDGSQPESTNTPDEGNSTYFTIIHF